MPHPDAHRAWRGNSPWNVEPDESDERNDIERRWVTSKLSLKWQRLVMGSLAV